MKAPLAERLRPKQLSDYLSQTHLIGEKGTISQMIKRDLIPSIILWGPPGIGKTSAARIICEALGFEVLEMNASDTRNKNAIQN